ncbi:MAG: hypothetical protein KF723_11150 [Rhizobiaceae bacterium]|nr:hypothetical protein [Rhizobiaceae bacterium]
MKTAKGNRGFPRDPSVLYVAICRGMDHEAKVISDRITWGILYSAGLFAASSVLIAILVGGRPHISGIVFIYVLMFGVSVSGVYFSVMVGRGVAAAHRQFDYLRAQYRKIDREYPQLILPRPFGDDPAHKSGNAAARVFPRIMMISWTIASSLSLSLALGFAFFPEVVGILIQPDACGS